MKQFISYSYLILSIIVLSGNCAIAQEWVNPIPDESQIKEAIQTHQLSNTVPANDETASFSWHDPITKFPEDLFKFGVEVFNPKNIPTIAGLAVLSGALMSVDHSTSSPFYKSYQTSSSSRSVTKKISWLGGGEFHLIVASLFGGAGLVLKNDRAIRTALQIVEAELVCGLTVQLLKRVSGRESPQSATTPRGLFRPFPNWGEYARNETKFYSFPSGHLSTSMAVLTVIADNYPESSWIRPVGYTALGIIGISLAARGWHWFSDYPLAIAIGYAYGKIISGRNQLFSDDQKDKSKLSVVPTYIYGPGLSINYSF